MTRYSTSFSKMRDESRSVFASMLRSLLIVFTASSGFERISFIRFTKFPALTPSKIIAPLFECHVISRSSQVKHHLPPLGDRQTALSAAFSSIIVDTNVFKSFRVPLHVNLLFFWPKKTIKLAVDKFRKISVLSESSSQSSLQHAMLIKNLLLLSSIHSSLVAAASNHCA